MPKENKTGSYLLRNNVLSKQQNEYVKPALVSAAIFSVMCLLLGLVYGMDPVRLVIYFSPGFFIIFGIVYAYMTTFSIKKKKNGKN
jgi:hypothetical protein